MQWIVTRGLTVLLSLAVVCTTAQAADTAESLSDSQKNAVQLSGVQFATAATGLLGPAARPARPQLSRPQLFGTREAFSADNRAFGKWRDAMHRAAIETAPEATCARSGETCRLAQWRGFIDSLRGRDPRFQIEAVNREMNRRSHTRDSRNWGVDDYWASPLEFLAKSGDCEDYAIAKYVSLLALGWDDGDLRLVVLKDRRLGQMHAVLVVYLDDQALVLDNQFARVVSANSIHHYTPLYSINQTGWWLHRS